MIHIRTWMEADLKPICAIERATFTEPWSYEAFESEFRHPQACYLVVTDEDTVVGYGGFRQVLDEGHMTNLAVAQAYTGKGVGRDLLQGLHEKGRRIGINRFTLEVRVSNHNALKLYKSMGYACAGRRKSFYRQPTEDAFIMWYNL